MQGVLFWGHYIVLVFVLHHGLCHVVVEQLRVAFGLVWVNYAANDYTSLLGRRCAVLLFPFLFLRHFLI